MGRGNTRARALTGRMAGWLSRCRAGNSFVPFLCGAIGYAAATAFSVPAFAQVSTFGSYAPTNSNLNTLTGTIDGGNGPGYYVTGGATLTVNNASLQNFTTTGGSGSGGGLGAGGAIFIDTGGTVVLNSSSFSHDSVIGGAGGANTGYGGTLNNGVLNNYYTGPQPGTNGANGIIYPDNEYIFGDGKGNGVPGINVGNGGNAINGLGGNGGIGGPGGAGWSSNPIAQQNLTISIQNLANAGALLGVQTAILVTDIAGSVAEYTSGADIFALPVAVATGITSSILAIVAGVNEGVDANSLASAVEAEIIAQGVVDTWNNLAAAGLAGAGGTGEAGGSGGAGSYGFGGGAGGQVALTVWPASPPQPMARAATAALAAPVVSVLAAAAAAPGFGACQNGNGAAGVCNSTSGAGGAGGAAGFGGGIGSTGGVTGPTTCSPTPCTPIGSSSTGGGGGDGYGGAIFVNAGAALTITGTTTFSGNEAQGGGSLNGGLAGGGAGTDLFMMTGSTVQIAPGAGNVITFNGTIADDSIASLGSSSTAQSSNYPIGSGAGLTVYSGLTVFNGANTYSGQTVINGGALGGPINTPTNTTGTPNYALTDGALQAADGVGLPITSNLTFAGPSQFTGGVLQTNGTFTRWVSPNPLNGSPNGVQWTGSGGFAAYGGALTVTLGAASTAGGQLVWGGPGFVPFGSSLIFGSANSNYGVTFTNAIDITGGTIGAGTAASILVGNNGNAAGSTATLSGVISGSGEPRSVGGGGFNGTLILTADNTYTGATVINSGTLELSGAGSIASSSGVTVDPS